MQKHDEQMYFIIYYDQINLTDCVAKPINTKAIRRRNFGGKPHRTDRKSGVWEDRTELSRGGLDIFFSRLSFLFSFSLSLGDGPI